MTTGYTLDEFAAWCNGAGRGGPSVGRHYRALQMIENFKKFKAGPAEENDYDPPYAPSHPRTG